MNLNLIIGTIFVIIIILLSPPSLSLETESNVKSPLTSSLCSDPLTKTTKTPLGIICLLPSGRSMLRVSPFISMIAKNVGPKMLQQMITKDGNIITNDPIKLKSMASRAIVSRKLPSQEMLKRGSVTSWIHKWTVDQFASNIANRFRQLWNRTPPQPTMIPLHPLPTPPLTPPIGQPNDFMTIDQMSSEHDTFPLDFGEHFADGSSIDHITPEQAQIGNQIPAAVEHEGLSSAPPLTHIEDIPQFMHEETQIGHGVVQLPPNFGAFGADRHHYSLLKDHHMIGDVKSEIKDQLPYDHAFAESQTTEQRSGKKDHDNGHNQPSMPFLSYPKVSKKDNWKWNWNWKPKVDYKQNDLIIPIYTNIKQNLQESPRINHQFQDHQWIHSHELTSDDRKKPEELQYDRTGESKIYHKRIESPNRQKRSIFQQYDIRDELRIPIVPFRRIPPSRTDSALYRPKGFAEINPRSFVKKSDNMSGWRPLTSLPMITPRSDSFNVKIERRKSVPQRDMRNYEEEMVVAESRRHRWDRIPHRYEDEDVEASESIKYLPEKYKRRSKNGRQLKDYDHERKPKRTERYHDDYRPSKSREIILNKRGNYQTKRQLRYETPKYEESIGREDAAYERAYEDVPKASFASPVSLPTIPGAVIKEVDLLRAHDLIKMLSKNQEFSGKKITNVYYLELPKDKAAADPPLSELRQLQTYKSPQRTKEIDYATADDLPMDDADFKMGEELCDGRVSGAFADVTKKCRIYYQCTSTTIDTFICPKGTLFDNLDQLCQPSDRVLCQY